MRPMIAVTVLTGRDTDRPIKRFATISPPITATIAAIIAAISVSLSAAVSAAVLALSASSSSLAALMRAISWVDALRKASSS